MSFLTIDVEEWFDAELYKSAFKLKPTKTSNIENEIDLFIDICNSQKIKSTCFIVGKLAKEKPFLVKKLSNAGHEIASHSYDHNLCYSLTQEEFKHDTEKSIKILEDITGKIVKGYRAPSWSVNEEISDWFYKTLAECSIIYSSSVYPGKTFLYGYPEFGDRIKIMGNTGVLEIPQKLIFCGKKIGCSGGFFLRLFPEKLISNFLKNLDEPTFIYIHPWELIENTSRLPKSSLLNNFINTYGIKRNEEKLRKILSKTNNSGKMIDFANIFLSK